MMQQRSSPHPTAFRAADSSYPTVAPTWEQCRASFRISKKDLLDDDDCDDTVALHMQISSTTTIPMTTDTDFPEELVSLLPTSPHPTSGRRSTNFVLGSRDAATADGSMMVIPMIPLQRYHSSGGGVLINESWAAH